MPRTPLLALLLAVLTLTACRTEPDATRPDTATVEVPDAPEAIVGSAEALLGSWVVIEEDGRQPARVYTVTFTRTGDYIVRDDWGLERHRRFTPSGDGLIALEDGPDGGPEQLAYSVRGERLTLTVPGSPGQTVLERRADLLEARPELTPDTPVDPEPVQPPVQD